MPARYYVRAGGRTHCAGDLRELGELMDGAIGADHPIELIYSSGGRPLDDAEFRGLMQRLSFGPPSPTGRRPDARPDSH